MAQDAGVLQRPSELAQALAPVTVILAAVLLSACAEAEVASGPGTGPHTYTLKGRIVEMPAAPGGEIQLEHEAIHDLVDSRGEKVGMDAMMMFFSLAGDAGAGFEAGHIVEFDLEIDWKREPLAIVTRLERLPDDTRLVFGAARPSGS